MAKKFIDPTITVYVFDEEQVTASTYIQPVQDYINAAIQSDAMHKRMELFMDLLEFK